MAQRDTAVNAEGVRLKLGELFEEEFVLGLFGLSVELRMVVRFGS
jgi:hypothetical protein